MANITELVSSATRGCIVAAPNKKLVISDLSNIEGRALAWLAREDWKLQAFRDADEGKGEDLYKLAYSKMFGINASEVDSEQRQIGKTLELSMGYQGGVKAFLTSALKFNIDLEALADIALPSIPADIRHAAQRWYDASPDRYGLSERVFIACDSLKRMWRNANSNIEFLWYDIDNKVRWAIERKEHTYYCSYLSIIREGAWLRIILPSGRSLCYPSPKIIDNQITYMGINSYTRKWERIKTYSGRLVENAIQAIARDVMAHSMMKIEKAGYPIVLTVHDEVITEVPDTENFNEKALSQLLSTVPDWASGLPLNASGFETHRYRKD